MSNSSSNYYAGRKVLVTGAGGFIGSHLCEGLVAAGAEVTAFVHYNSRTDWGLIESLPEETQSSLRIVAGDIRDPFAVRSAVEGQSVVFHLAALIAIPFSYEAPGSYVSTNINGTLNVLRAAQEVGCERVVHTSTSECYGTAQYTPIDEKHPLVGQSPYSATKIGADKLAESFYCSFNLPVVTLRPFNTFGPRQSARAVIPTIISQAFDQPQIKLGSAEPVRDFNYVTDTVAGFMAAGEKTAAIGRVVNCGRGEGITIGELATKILGLMDCDKQVVFDQSRVRPENSEVFALLCDNRLAAELLEQGPKVSLDQGLRNTIDYIAANRDSFKSHLYIR
ncbi:MAG: NAD dependent epimerase/dehydratase [Myxococcota bacterium]|jgi:NAD dependent epimerase/dehydratase